MLTEADHKVRSHGVGSSEIAMLIYVADPVTGEPRPVSPWGGKHKLWRRKTGKDGPQDEKSYMTRGTFMEPSLLAWYAHDHSVECFKPKSMRHKEFPFVVDSCDGLTYPKGTLKKDARNMTPSRVVEAKCSSFWARDEWGAAGTDEIPHHYLLQCMWHLGAWMPVDGLCDVPMDDGGKRTDYQVEWDSEFYLALVCEAEKFWRDHVVADKEPAVDDYIDATSWLSRYLDHKDGLGCLEANEEQIKLLLRYRQMRLRAVVFEGEMAEMQEKIQRDIGDYDGMVIPGTKQKVLWKPSKGSTRVGWKAVADELLHKLTIADPAFDRAAFVRVTDEHSKTTQGSRRWTPTALIKNEG